MIETPMHIIPSATMDTSAQVLERILRLASADLPPSVELRFTSRSTVIGPLDADLTLVVQGWSATLHAETRAHRVDLRVAAMAAADAGETAGGAVARLAGDAEFGARLLLSLMHAEFEEQTRRADGAEILGIAAPIVDRTDLAHVRIDRTIAQRVEVTGRDVGDFVHAVMNAMAKEAAATMKEGGLSAGRSPVMIDDFTVGAVLTDLKGHPVPLLTVEMLISAEPPATFDGDLFAVDTENLPDTLIVAAQGRRLGQIFDTSSDLDRRRIEGVYPTTGGVILQLRPDPIAIPAPV